MIEYGMRGGDGAFGFFTRERVGVRESESSAATA